MGFLVLLVFGLLLIFLGLDVLKLPYIMTLAFTYGFIRYDQG